MPEQPLLTLQALGFQDAELDELVSSAYFMGGKQMRLRDLIAALQRVYTGKIGAEFMHIQNPRVRNWVREKFVGTTPEDAVPREVRLRILRLCLDTPLTNKQLAEALVVRGRSHG